MNENLGEPFSVIQYLCLLVQHCKMVMKSIVSPCQDWRGDVKNRHNITPFPPEVSK